MGKTHKIVNKIKVQVSIHEASMTLSLERMARLLLGILTAGGADCKRVPRLDPMALSDRDLADLNLPAEVRSRFLGQREVQNLRRRV